ncbi:hypothetical protein HPB50_006577 [Hyalomma asiaticum]|uniref:Uncharacterized protein n=1 Tax=Hyalomma asiaticum TaxID=266040 RepID=A0ACB7SNA7_HYAAI|nr:hypothetical protein HPB50_006577 [Hyalomma asiaticum]
MRNMTEDKVVDVTGHQHYTIKTGVHSVGGQDAFRREPVQGAVKEENLSGTSAKLSQVAVEIAGLAFAVTHRRFVVAHAAAVDGAGKDEAGVYPLNTRCFA